MAQEDVANFVINKPVPIVFTNSLLTATAFRNTDGTQGLPRYNCQALIPPDHPQLAALKEIVVGVARKAFPQRIDAGQWTAEGLKFPLRAGEAINRERTMNGKKPIDFYIGKYVLFAQKPEKSMKGDLLQPPVLVVIQGGKMVEYADGHRPAAKDFFYNGVHASLSIQFKAYAGFGGGVTCYIDRVLSMNTGERIQIGRDNETVFGGVEQYKEHLGAVSTVDPAAGMAALDARFAGAPDPFMI